MRKLFYIALTAASFSVIAGNENGKDSTVVLKSCFYSAKDTLESMLSGKSTLNYERAVFITENAYYGNAGNFEKFQKVLDLHTERIKRLANANNKVSEQNFKPWYTETVEQKKEKYRKLLDNWAIYSYITDTISMFPFVHLPFQYANNDPLGTIDWTNSQVFSLLDAKRTGNCYALASLFKIFAERLNTDAKICTAPGHIWIKHKDLNGTSYNVELSAKAFPGLGKLETLTYTTDEGTISDISMRTLDLKKSVALCLVQLAKGYEHKFKNRTDDFILGCSELALKYDSLNLNAMLLKAEVLEERIIQKKKTVAQLQADKEFSQYQKLIVRLHKLGYREMPLDMKNLIIAEIMKEAFIVTHNYTPNADTSYVTLSKGIFEEMHEKKPKEKYFRTIFNTSTKKIERFENADTLYNKYYFDPVAFAFTMDALHPTPASISPYSAMNGNPILNIDPDGNWAVSVHYNITYTTLLKLGYSTTVADNIAHHASVYADHPEASILRMDNAISRSDNSYRAGIDYSATQFSQKEWRSNWHAMMSNAEAAGGMTHEQAMQRGLAFGWSNIFSQQEKEDIGKLGQGLHALQDAYAHKGANTEEHLGKNSMGLYTSQAWGMLYNDEFGNTNQAELITQSAGILLQLFKGNTSSLQSGMTLDFTGLSSEQLKTTQGLFGNAGYNLNAGTENGIYTIQKITK